jgi:tight adherence protein B
MGLYIGIGVFVLLLIGGGVAFFVMRNRKSAATERLEQFAGRGQAEQEGEKKSGEKGPSALTTTLNKAIEDRGLGGGLAMELAQADLKWTVAEFWALNVIVMIGVAVIAWLIYGGIVMPIAGFGAGFFLPKMYIKFRKGNRLKTFNDQLGDGITLMANGLRSGYSLLQAMEAVGQEMPAPMSVEFRRVVQEIGLGVNNERAFQNLLRRVPSEDLDLMVTAINVQHEVGGNLAEILEVIGHVIRERIRIKGQIAVLTAQGQLSGYIISFLPVVLGLLLYAMNEPYMARMIFSCPDTMPEWKCTQPCGWIMIGAGLITVSAGFFAIQKIIDIDV